MKTVCMLALLGAAVAAAGAGAEENVGRVRGVYVEAAPGVLIERSLARSSGRRWADVELVAPMPGERTRVLVQVPRDLPAKTGDVVAVQLAGPRNEAIPLISVSRLTEIRSSALAGLEPPAK
jgi:hypothetical protein